MTRLAILVEEGFQDEEVLGPKYIAEFLGWEVALVNYCNPGAIRGKHGIVVKATRFLAPELIDSTTAADYDAVLIPGGWQCPERLRQNPTVLEFVRAMHATGKVVAAICHGPWVLASAGMCRVKEEWSYSAQQFVEREKQRPRRMTCYPGCKDDIINAGTEWVDQPVVTDGNVVTAQHYRDIPAFMRAMRAIAELLK